jgi:ATP-dependent Clp protease adaptor protein ClpS
VRGQKLINAQDTNSRPQNFAKSSPAILAFKVLVMSAGEDDDSLSGVPGTVVISKPKSETRTPALYRVIIMNDDYTPMDFVIHVLQKFFNKDIPEATKIMLQVHQQGAGICGIFTYEIAETKVYQVNQYSRQNRHPLKCTMEKV